MGPNGVLDDNERLSDKPQIQTVRLVAEPNNLLNLQQFKQYGETCKLLCLFLMMQICVDPSRKPDLVPLGLPLLDPNGQDDKGGDETWYGIALSKGSQVGELHSMSTIEAISEKAGFPVQSLLADEDEASYITRLQQLVDRAIPVMVIFDVVIVGANSGFPKKVNEHDNNYDEHATLIVGHIADKNNNATHFIAFHWEKFWIFDAIDLAKSALSLHAHPEEKFQKIESKQKDSGIIYLWVAHQFLQYHLLNDCKVVSDNDNPKNCVRSTQSSSAEEKLRGVFIVSSEKMQQRADALHVMSFQEFLRKLEPEAASRNVPSFFFAEQAVSRRDADDDEESQLDDEINNCDISQGSLTPIDSDNFDDLDNAASADFYH